MIKRIIIMFMAVSFIFTGVALAEEEPSEIELVLQEMDELVSEDVLEWLISLYDIEKSGFYHAVSSRDNTEFLPDIESTRFAFDILVEAGILPAGVIPDEVLSPNIKSLLIEWLQSMQDEEDGYFYHPQWGKSITESRKNRDLGAAALLNRLGAQALYPLPSERITQDEPDEDDQIPAYLRSEEALLNWMESHWNNGGAYSAGNSYSSALSQIRDAGLIDTAVAFITEKQNPETGLWGEGLSYFNSNAAMKMQGFYSTSDTPFPYIEKMIESITTIIIEGEEPGAVVDIWNPIVAINGALDSYDTIPPDLRESIDEVILPLAEISIENIRAFKRDDGGFSYSRKNSSITSQGAYVGYGLEEGDVNATTVATVRLRNSLYQMAGVARSPLFEDTDFARDLIEQWEELPPVEKVEKPIGLDEDFEDIEQGRLPIRYIKTVSGGNRVEVAADPLGLDNQALLFERNALNSNSRLIIPVESGENNGKSKKTTVSMDIMIESPVAGTLFYNDVGTNAVQWVIVGREDGFALSNRRSGVGVGTTFADSLAYGEWHNLKIEYTPEGFQNTVINYYIDNELMLTTNEYFNRGDSSIEPADYVDNIRFDNFNSAGIMNLYVDNLSMLVEDVPEEPTGLDEDFDEINPGELPLRFYPRISGGNRVEVAADPTDLNNQALLIERNRLNTDSRLNIAVNGGDNPYKTTVSMDIMIESPTVGTLFYNDVGTNAVQWVIVGREDGFSLSNRRSGVGIGTTFTDPLEYGEWHNLKIEYIPDGKENTMIHYYIDDELMLSTNEYFNRGDANIEPASSIDNIRFDNFRSAELLNLFIDNLQMTVEPVSTTSMLELIDQFTNKGAFIANPVGRVLKAHLNSVQVFERQERADKVIQHMNRYHSTLDHWADQMSEDAYNVLKEMADQMIAEWE